MHQQQQQQQHQRYWHDSKKGLGERGDEEKALRSNGHLDWGSSAGAGAGANYYSRKTRPKFLPVLFLFFLVFCFYLFAPHLFVTYSFVHDSPLVQASAEATSIFSSMPHGTLHCDRSDFRSDICFMKGDVRTNSIANSIILYSSNSSRNTHKNWEHEDIQHEKIRPYTRKWETSIMNTVEELDLVVKHKTSHHSCQVKHSVPAIVFSTGGYTGNVYHEFNDGILPLYITSHTFNKEVVFVVLEYHRWWVSKYGDILARLSNYPPIDFNGDLRTHCFSEIIIGLRIHGDLIVDPSKMQGKKTIRDFRNVLDKGYRPRIRGLIKDEELEAKSSSISPFSSIERVGGQEGNSLWKPKLVILSRNGSRSITNEVKLVELAEKIGFQVQVLRPDRTTELAKIYRALNSSDTMVGVHGAAMTHFLFMRPGTVFIQVIPLGTNWAAETYYGEPAIKLSLKYLPYKILPRESSLYGFYDKEDPVLKDPDSVNAKGWEFTKKIYLDRQMVTLNLIRFRRYLIEAYEHSIANKKKGGLR